MIKKITGLALVTSVVLFACKKSDGNSNSNATAILGKWSLTRNVSYDYVNGVFLDSMSTQVSSVDYIYFDKNGKAYSYENDANNGNQSVSDTSNYSILNNQFMLVGTAPLIDTFKILTLNAHSLIVADSYITPNNVNGTFITYDTVQYSK
jgi:hypothetical protein